MSQKAVCGIDFGTSNSAIAVAAGAEPYLIRVENNSETIPSAIFFPEVRGAKPHFGRDAIGRFTDGERGRLMRSLKRLMGLSIMNKPTRLNGESIKLSDVVKIFVQNLKDRMDEVTTLEIHDVVMGRPVHFNDNDPEGDTLAQHTLEKIALQVGFKNVEFQYEPIAAAFAHEARLSAEKLALVVDIGGGTSDFTVMKLSKSYIHKADRREDILANTGVRIGGNDFDKNLALRSFMPTLGMGSTYGRKGLDVPTAQYFDLATWSKINDLYTFKTVNFIKTILHEAHDKQKYERLLQIVERQKGHPLLAKVENAKIELTANQIYDQNIDFIEEGLHAQVSRTQFEEAIDLEYHKINACIDECLVKAGVKSPDISLVILTGGSTEIPLLRDHVKRVFSKAEISEENKLSSVALGLAYDGIRRFGG
jgi:hypothetical chaperone protein